MKDINCVSEEEYKLACKKIEEMLPYIHGDTPKDDPLCVEYKAMTATVEKYETAHFPIPKPTIAEIIADALDDMGYSQNQLAELIRVSPSKVNDYLSGKAEPTLKIAGRLCRVLHIAPAEMLLNEEPAEYEYEPIMA